MTAPSIVRCVRKSDYVPYGKVGDPIMIQGSALKGVFRLVDSESTADIIVDSESATDVLVDSEGVL